MASEKTQKMLMKLNAPPANIISFRTTFISTHVCYLATQRKKKTNTYLTAFNVTAHPVLCIRPGKQTEGASYCVGVNRGGRPLNTGSLAMLCRTHPRITSVVRQSFARRVFGSHLHHSEIRC